MLLSLRSHQSSDGAYKPTEHDGKTKDGEQDARVSSEHG